MFKSMIPILLYPFPSPSQRNPNPNVNFINALPDDNDDARQLLRVLAAQVHPVMKAHGFVVNSLEEVCLC